MAEREPNTEERGSRATRRLIAAGLTVPLVGAAILWWIAGSDMTMARWISLGVIILALAGWYFSRERERDE